MAVNSLVIESLYNTADPLLALCTISGTPQGTLRFYAGRIPEPARAKEMPSALFGANTYTVRLPYGPTAWYVWAVDDTGMSVEPEAIWAEIGESADVNQVGHAVRDILESHKKALDKAYWRYYPQADGGFKEFVYGSPIIPEAFPAVVVTEPRWNSSPVATGYTFERSYRLSVGFTIIHQDEVNELEPVVEIARAASLLFNTPYYYDILLPCGITVQNCLMTQGEARDVELGNGKWAAIGSLVFSGEAVVSDNGLF